MQAGRVLTFAADADTGGLAGVECHGPVLDVPGCALDWARETGRGCSCIAPRQTSWCCTCEHLRMLPLWGRNPAPLQQVVGRGSTSHGLCTATAFWLYHPARPSQNVGSLLQAGKVRYLHGATAQSAIRQLASVKGCLPPADLLPSNVQSRLKHAETTMTCRAL